MSPEHLELEIKAVQHDPEFLLKIKNPHTKSILAAFSEIEKERVVQDWQVELLEYIATLDNMPVEMVYPMVDIDVRLAYFLKRAPLNQKINGIYNHQNVRNYYNGTQCLRGNHFVNESDKIIVYTCENKY